MQMIDDFVEHRQRLTNSMIEGANNHAVSDSIKGGLLDKVSVTVGDQNNLKKVKPLNVNSVISIVKMFRK
jgi:hypothetical protein